MEGIISKYDDDFNGVIIQDNHVEVSIPGALVGETIRYHIEHTSPHVPKAWGVCDALIKSSCERVTPQCPLAWPVSGPCPGCPLMHMTDRAQNQLKAQFVLNALQKFGITYIREVVCHPAPENDRYRNRTDFIVGEHRGKLILGAYKNRTHDIFPIRTCPILRSPINQVLDFIRELANRRHIPAARNFEQANGALRYVSIFANDQHKVLVDLVCKSACGAVPSWLPDFALEMRSFSAIQGVSYSLNDSPNNALRVAPSSTIWGESRLPERHNGHISLYSASGFTQLNTDVAASIYAAAKDWHLSSPRIIWDLYCGAGAFGRTFNPNHLYGAEFSPSAIEAARKISAEDRFPSTFEVIDLEKSWPEWPSPDLILLDPPRKGLSKIVIDHIRQMNTPTLLYMSCNPVTFAQNIAELSDLYVLTRVEAFDMMPQTRQVEVLGLLNHR